MQFNHNLSYKSNKNLKKEFIFRKYVHTVMFQIKESLITADINSKSIWDYQITFNFSLLTKEEHIPLLYLTSYKQLLKTKLTKCDFQRTIEMLLTTRYMAKRNLI